jgi:serine phosphatase RsbU (regulator of sigma subunit)
LLVTACASQAQLIEGLLTGAKAALFELDWASSLPAALKRLEAQGIAAILLDLSLVDKDKLSLFLRIHHAAPTLPVVLLASIEEESVALEAARYGASDYLIKGFTERNVLVRSLRFAIERQRRRLAEQELGVTKENMRLGWEVKRQRFPAAHPGLPGFDIVGASYPADVTGGDFFDYIPLEDQSLGVVVADVSGHGICPATRMAETRAYLRAFAQTLADPSQILRRLNRALYSDPLGTHFVTLLLARLDPRERVLQYMSAGHPTAFVCNAQGAVKAYLHSSTTPLGVIRESQVPAANMVEFDPGDMVLLMTDGILEATAPDDTTFGHQRALRALRLNRDRPSEQIVEAIYLAAREFCSYAPQTDDMTVVVVKRAPNES